MTFEEVIEFGKKSLLDYAPSMISAIVILTVGLKLIAFIKKLVLSRLIKKEFDESLQQFVTNLISWTFKIILYITVLGQLGKPSTSFVAILGAAGLAVGLALQGSLSNFAGGVLIMLFRPFKVGDIIQAQGETGKVKEIDIFTTKLLTPENKVVIVPNGVLSNGNITNFTAEGVLIMILSIRVSYESNIKTTKQVITGVLNGESRILNDPIPLVELANLGESSLDFIVKSAVKSDDYWPVHYKILSEIKEALDEAGIEIPVIEIVSKAK